MSEGTTQTITVHRIFGDGRVTHEVATPVARHFYILSAYGEVVYAWSGTDRAGNPLTVDWIPNPTPGPGIGWPDILALETSDGAQ